jgi:hypothetical protein
MKLFILFATALYFFGKLFILPHVVPDYKVEFKSIDLVFILFNLAIAHFLFGKTSVK